MLVVVPTKPSSPVANFLTSRFGRFVFIFLLLNLLYLSYHTASSYSTHHMRKSGKSSEQTLTVATKSAAPLLNVELEQPPDAPETPKIADPSIDDASAAPPVYKMLPTFNSSWTKPQRPIAKERALSASWFVNSSVHSLDPPGPLHSMAKNEEERKELDSRLIIGIALGVHSGTFINIDDLYIMTILLPSFVKVAQPHHLYRFYFAFDENDKLFQLEATQRMIKELFQRMLDEEDAKRWHPTGYISGQTIDYSTLIATIHFVRCGYASKPSWAHSDAAMAAFSEGADYVFRTNDDTEFPTVGDWADTFVLDLRDRPMPNVGMVGPMCGHWIMTHDFTHRTHAHIFGVYYPRALPDWSSDDWITITYDQCKLAKRREDITVVHTLKKSRYNPLPRHVRLGILNDELVVAWRKLQEYAQKEFKTPLHCEPKRVLCC